MRRKFISMLLSAAMLASTLSAVPVLAENETAVADDNFENYADMNEVKSIYSLSGSSNMTLERVTEDNRALWFRQQTDSGTLDVKKTWEDITDGFAVISTSFKQSVLTATRLQQVWNYTDSKRPYVIYTYPYDSTTGTLQMDCTIDGKESTIVLCSYSKDQWYRVSTVIDIANRLVYVFVDGQLINPSGFGFKQDTDRVNGINIQTNASNVTGRMFLDNFYVDKFKSFEAAKAAITAHAIANDMPSEVWSALEKSEFSANAERSLAVLRSENSASALTDLTALIDAAIPSATKTLFNSDFWKLSEGQLPSNASSYKALSNCTMASENGVMYAKLTRGGNRARLLKELSESKTAENMTVSFSFMQKEKTAISAVARSTDINGSMQPAYVISSDGTSLYLNGGNNSQVEIVENYIVNQPYDIKVEIDYLNQCVSCYVDSVYAGTVPFGTDYISSKKGLARVFDSYTDITGEYYIGNITVASDVLSSPDCYIAGSSFTGTDGEKYAKPVSGGTFDKTYAVKNSAGGKAVVYSAVYSGGTLTGISSYDITDEPAGQNIEINVNIALPASDDISVKQFVWDGKTTPKAANTLRTADATGTTVYIVGDSTVATYDYAQYYPQTGWGQMLGNYLNGVTVRNFAIPGSSLKQMYKQGVFNSVIEQGKPGDFLLIQFGHNDSKLTYAEYSDVCSDYRAYLKYYTECARAKGMIPIYVTSPVRRVNSIFGGESSLTSYADTVKSVGRALDVPVIDLFTASSELVSCLDSEETDGSKKLFLFVDANDSRYFGSDSEYLTSVYNKASATADNTHFCAYGADVLAGIVAEGLENCGLEIASRVDEVKHIPSEQ